MKLIYLSLCIFLLAGTSQAQVPKTQTFPSENSEVVPQKAPEKNKDAYEKSTFEETVEGPKATMPGTRSGAEPTVKEKAERAAESAKYGSSIRRDMNHHTGMLGYQLLSTWVPSKWAFGYTHNFNEKWSLEGEYSWSSIGLSVPGIDIAGVTEKRYSLLGRRFIGNSFNLIIGAFYNDFEASVGNDIVASMTQVDTRKVGAEGVGLTVGLGNRWQWSNGITFGIDYLRLNQMIFETNVEDNILKDIPGGENREDIKDLLSKLNHIPTVVLFGVHLGYSF